MSNQRSQTLVVVEGDDEKEKLFYLLLLAFPELNIKEDDIVIYQTNIYDLYNKLTKEYGEQFYEQDVDLPYVLNKISRLPSVKPTKKRYYQNILLIFDYERHHDYFEESRIQELQQCFSDMADNGQLYINYPMLESYSDCDLSNETDFLNKTFAITKGGIYKSKIKETPLYKIFEIPDILKKIIDNRKGEAHGQELTNDLTRLLLDSSCEVSLDSIDFTQLVLRERETLDGFRKMLCSKLKVAFNDNCSYRQLLRQKLTDIIKLHVEKYYTITKLCEEIDYKNLLDLQNAISREQGKIWVINTAIMVIVDYNPSLVYQ